ncbi:hypothetical protein HDV05_001058 [Chytridiales sp. JEL 0842]|nr:hypothetical protein HDV05_001058 [Chytridiales sp. JEL 0842]
MCRPTSFLPPPPGTRRKGPQDPAPTQQPGYYGGQHTHRYQQPNQGYNPAQMQKQPYSQQQPPYQQQQQQQQQQQGRFAPRTHAPYQPPQPQQQPGMYNNNPQQPNVPYYGQQPPAPLYQQPQTQSPYTPAPISTSAPVYVDPIALYDHQYVPPSPSLHSPASPSPFNSSPPGNLSRPPFQQQPDPFARHGSSSSTGSARSDVLPRSASSAGIKSRKGGVPQRSNTTTGVMSNNNPQNGVGSGFGRGGGAPGGFPPANGGNVPLGYNINNNNGNMNMNNMSGGNRYYPQDDFSYNNNPNSNNNYIPPNTGINGGVPQSPRQQPRKASDRLPPEPTSGSPSSDPSSPRLKRSQTQQEYTRPANRNKSQEPPVTRSPPTDYGSSGDYFPPPASPPHSAHSNHEKDDDAYSYTSSESPTEPKRDTSPLKRSNSEKKTGLSEQIDSIMADLMNEMAVSADEEEEVASPVKNMCAGCDKEIIDEMDGFEIESMSAFFHPECFKCTTCDRKFSEELPYIPLNGKAYCERDYESQLCDLCEGCQQPIQGKPVHALNRLWHPHHLLCASCNLPISGTHFEHQGKVYCQKDYTSLIAPACLSCKLPVQGETIMALNGAWHKPCFVCKTCKKPFEDKSFYALNGQPLCRYHYHAENKSLCGKCMEPVEGACAEIVELDKRFHPRCWCCSYCSNPLDEIYYSYDGSTFCEACIRVVFKPNQSNNGGNGNGYGGGVSKRQSVFRNL